MPPGKERLTAGGSVRLAAMNRTAAGRWSGLLGLLLLGLALACNAPLEVEPSPAPPTRPPLTTPPATTVAPTDTPAPDGAPATIPAAATLTAEPSRTPRPTFTPIAAPTLGATVPPPTVRPTQPPVVHTAAAPTATSTTAGPLTFSYDIRWQIDPADPGQAIATVTIRAAGGNGVYRYYRDNMEVDGPVFTYRWASCRGNPGSLRVDSGDGQSASQDYFVQVPCPTPTPTP